MLTYFIITLIVAIGEGIALFLTWKEKNHWLHKFLSTQEELLPIELESRGITK